LFWGWTALLSMTPKSSSQQLKKILWFCDALPTSYETDKKKKVCMKKMGKYTISFMHEFYMLYKTYNIALKSFFLKSVNSVQILYKTCAFCGYRQCLYTIFFSQASPWWYMFKNASSIK
jgi:uncharacterized membrane protein